MAGVLTFAASAVDHNQYLLLHLPPLLSGPVVLVLRQRRAHLNSYSPVRFSFPRQHAETLPEITPSARTAARLEAYSTHSPLEYEPVSAAARALAGGEVSGGDRLRVLQREADAGRRLRVQACHGRGLV